MTMLSLILKLMTVWLKLLIPGGFQRIAAENIALCKQLIILTPHQKRAPKLTTRDHIIFDHVFFWNAADLQNKLDSFQHYYNLKHGHCSIHGNTPLQHANKLTSNMIHLNNYRWKTHCRGLFQLPLDNFLWIF